MFCFNSGYMENNANTDLLSKLILNNGKCPIISNFAKLSSIKKSFSKSELNFNIR